MTRRLILVLAAFALLAGACGDDDDAASDDGAGEDVSETDDPVVDDTGDATGDDAGGEDEVDIQDFAFVPDSLDVDAGTTVSWSNGDSVTHTVTSGTDSASDGTFDESVDSGGSVDIDFDEPGTYAYFCAIHPSMTGEVVVS